MTQHKDKLSTYRRQIGVHWTRSNQRPSGLTTARIQATARADFRTGRYSARRHTLGCLGLGEGPLADPSAELDRIAAVLGVGVADFYAEPTASSGTDRTTDVARLALDAIMGSQPSGTAIGLLEAEFLRELAVALARYRRRLLQQEGFTRHPA